MYNELKMEILKNNGGTYNDKLENANLKTGFMVSIEGYEYVTQDINDAIKKMVEYTEIVASKKGYYIGAWVDTQDNNNIYIDISKRLESKREAEKTARANRQKAYFDIKALDSVYLDYEIVYYSVYKNVYRMIKKDTKECYIYNEKTYNENEYILENKIYNQVFIKSYDSTSEIPSNYRNDKNNYFILKDYININEL